MDPTRTAEGILLGGDARQRFYDSRGIGRPIDDGDLLLTPVEAAFLLYREDIRAVDGANFEDFLGASADEDLFTRFKVYKDFRDRGFLLQPASPDGRWDFVVYERGHRPPDGERAYHVVVHDEDDRIPASDLKRGVLAIVDAEAEIGYVEIGVGEFAGELDPPPSMQAPATVAGSRVILPLDARRLYTHWFFGQPVGGRDELEDPVQLSLVEAAYLCEVGAIDLEFETVRQRGREQLGERFDRVFDVYRSLRSAGVVPKTGYKFGADFRVYQAFTSIDDMGHSDALVRIVDRDTLLAPSELALDIRLAHGVGKRMVFALTSGNHDTTITWRSIARVTP